MKYSIFSILFFALFLCTSCGDDDEMPAEMTPEYHVHILSPTVDTKKVDDNVQIKVEVEDHNGGTVHHVNFRIVNKADGTEIYNKPDVAHVHETDGSWEFEDQITLDNVDGHTDWLFIGKVWGHEAGMHETADTVEFHVHPK